MGQVPGQLSGIVGQIRWGYYIAAAINGYALRPNGPGSQGFTLEGTVILKDPFKLTQAPLVFAAPYRYGDPPVMAEWIWPVIDFTIADTGRITARLGPPT